jgi:hypothetical protein
MRAASFDLRLSRRATRFGALTPPSADRRRARRLSHRDAPSLSRSALIFDDGLNPTLKFPDLVPNHGSKRDRHSVQNGLHAAAGGSLVSDPNLVHLGVLLHLPMIFPIANSGKTAEHPINSTH